MKSSDLKTALMFQQKLQSLDKDLGFINKIAHILGNCNTETSFKITVLDKSVNIRKGKEEVRELCDCDTCKKEKAAIHELNGILNDCQGLEVLAIVQRRKQDQRDGITKELKKMGVE